MKQKKFILAIVLILSIALPAFAKEGGDWGDNRGPMGGRPELSDGPRHGFMDFLLGRRDDRQDQEDREDQNENENERASTTKALREEMKDRMQSLHDQMGGFLGNIAGKRVKHVSKLFEATINRFEKMVDRFESRIQKLHDAGGNTTEAQSDVDLAKANLTQAKADLVNLEATTFLKEKDIKGSSTATSTDEENFAKAKTLALKIRDSLRSAKTNLMNALKAIIEVSKTVKVDEHATSTATSTED